MGMEMEMDDLAAGERERWRWADSGREGAREGGTGRERKRFQVRAGKREMPEDVFVEASTGRVIPTASPAAAAYGAVEAAFKCAPRPCPPRRSLPAAASGPSESRARGASAARSVRSGACARRCVPGCGGRRRGLRRLSLSLSLSR